jgi:hypothetical protein
LVGEVGDAALEGLGVEEAHGFLVAGLAEQALAGPEGDREDLQPQLVDQVVLDQRVRQLAAARWPPRGEPLVASPAQQEGPGGQRLVERELGKLRAISDQADPAAGPEAFVTGPGLG